MSQPIISFRYSAESVYDDTIIVYLDDMTEEQQNDDSGEEWGTMIVKWSPSVTIRVDLDGYSPVEAADEVGDVCGVVEDWLNFMAFGAMDWDVQDFCVPNEDVEEAFLTEGDLADYLDENDMLDVPEHLDGYRGVIYQRMADDMIAGGEVTIGDVAIFHNA